MRGAARCAGGEGLSGSYKPTSPPHLNHLRRSSRPVPVRLGSPPHVSFVYVSSGSGPQERPSVRWPLPCHLLLSATNRTPPGHLRQCLCCVAGVPGAPYMIFKRARSRA
ncbi:hypothetical protein NDU88_006981 [Pleurodeles waltl]|uniref:Uncharacterized protein n=1 Tax=Pleurodeles waltl TaxID=8319 RepID=A0AAV7LS04_PLEWA|nr:hypothetical protein NDU88_006981 [Pleurodeles waltl]